MSSLSFAQIDAIARAAHEANRTWCELLGDKSQLPWEQAPDWARTSARNGVLSVTRGEHTPAASHASWLAEKVATGWTYGPTKNPERKEHPCMVAYDQLPFEQQYKDTLFVATVRSLVEALSRIPQ